MKVLLKLLALLSLFAFAGGAVAGGSDSASDTYRVVWGDTLTKIAKKFDSSVDRIAEHNGIKNKNFIRAGMALEIPRESTIAVREEYIAAHAEVSDAGPEIKAAGSCNAETLIDDLGYPEEVRTLFTNAAKGVRISDKVAVQTPRRFSKHFVTVYKDVLYQFILTRDCRPMKIVHARGPPTATDVANLAVPSGTTEATQYRKDISDPDTSDIRRDTYVNARQALRQFLNDAVGAPYDTRPLEDAMMQRYFSGNVSFTEKEFQEVVTALPLTYLKNKE